MSLTSRLYRQVPGDVRGRGHPYFKDGSVSIQRGSDSEVIASVQGTSVYEVRLTREGNTIRAFCSCPYFEDRLSTCKHIWATILAVENKGYLGSRGGYPRSLRLVEDTEGLESTQLEVEDDWLDEDDQSEFGEYHRPSTYWNRSTRSAPSPARGQGWKGHLAQIQAAGEEGAVVPGDRAAAASEPVYIVDVEATLGQRNGLAIELCQRVRKRDGEWSKPRSQGIPVQQIPRLADPADRRILGLMNGISVDSYSRYAYSSQVPTHYYLSPLVQEEIVRLMCQTGRCYLRRTRLDRNLRALRWDEEGPWELWLRVVADPAGSRYVGVGQLRRGDEHKDIMEPVLLVAGGLVFWDDRVGPLQDFGAFDWVPVLRQPGVLTVPEKQKDEFLGTLLATRVPRLDLPPELAYDEVHIAPRPRIVIRKPTQNYWGPDRLPAELSFDYAGTVVPAEPPAHGVYQRDTRRLLLRDRAAEEAAAALLAQLGFRRGYSSGAQNELALAPRTLPSATARLLEAGWHVEAEGKIYRRPGAFHIEVRSGIDWFELHGSADFDGASATLPELLAALQRGESLVKLGDGSFGQLPEEWLKKYGLVAGLGTTEGDHLRFTKTQVGFLDALLAAQPDITFDEQFAQAREALRSFAGVKAQAAPKGFVGELRGYQREGLGWLHFLQQFGFGGCLADDMGLGKTVMVLALLESRRQLRAKANGTGRPAPSLAVVPKSLVFNWVQEAARFTPKLRVLDHTGAGRVKPGEHFDDFDLVLTTYGTLRRDAADFQDVEFDYCILDEAQAVKNAKSESAKAVRLLRCRQRLALSGTPVENHLGELWSMFEFLNPGMLGNTASLRLEGGWRNPSEETRTLLARALRPYILRRTKEQVAKDLPAKTEQTVYCDLEAPQRKLYDQLKHHYRQALLPRITRDGMKKSAIQILEALLRLRQAACHPGLIDKKKTGEPSAKLDLLREQLAEVVEEGHKALVFSQFTSMLAIVRDRLDEDGIPYLYLDGRTRDRQSRVEQFQSDPEAKLFLISLKAGGLGLNLTAAEYVFLLDPWWNPAVEAQAIDRAHRIGQTERVFAYRLIARDTVEEKILELQQKKRALADAIINADNSLIRNLSREDLELLLS